MAAFHRIVRILLLLFCCQDCISLKNVTLTIEPKVVQRHEHSILRCTYDLENKPLYTLKFYRGLHEFYRYTPTEHPSTKIFPFEGIYVDVNHSNSTQVYLRNIEFNLSGNFSCEVTIDEPVFSTRTDTQAMLVVQLPENPPTISVRHEPLDYGDTLKANCSSPPSKPPARLKFILNNMTVTRTKPLSIRKTQEAAWSDLMLELPVTEFHFYGGKLMLTCVARVADIYLQNATVELHRARDPVPDWVSAPDSANSMSMYVIVQFITCLILFLINS